MDHLFFCLGDLLQGFFTFYENFQFNERIIAIHTSCPLQRCQAFQGLISDSNVKNTSIVVQDPFKLSHNVAQNMIEKGLQLFIKACHSSRLILSVPDANLLGLLSTSSESKATLGQVQSQVFTISFPYCNQKRNLKETLHDHNKSCYDFVQEVLSNDLQMLIYEQPRNLDQLQKAIRERHNVQELSRNALGDGKVRENPHDFLKGNVIGAGKRKLSQSHDSHDIQPVEKKIKIDTSEKDTTLYVYGTNDTLRLCKKNPNLTTHGPSSATLVLSELNVEHVVPDKRTSAECTKESTVTFVVKVTLRHKSTTKHANEVCKVTLEPFSDGVTLQTNFEDFQVFYAYMKKAITSVLQ